MNRRLFKASAHARELEAARLAAAERFKQQQPQPQPGPTPASASEPLRDTDDACEDSQLQAALAESMRTYLSEGVGVGDDAGAGDDTAEYKEEETGDDLFRPETEHQRLVKRVDILEAENASLREMVSMLEAENTALHAAR